MPVYKNLFELNFNPLVILRQAQDGKINCKNSIQTAFSHQYRKCMKQLFYTLVITAIELSFSACSKKDIAIPSTANLAGTWTGTYSYTLPVIGENINFIVTNTSGALLEIKGDNKTSNLKFDTDSTTYMGTIIVQGHTVMGEYYGIGTAPIITLYNVNISSGDSMLNGSWRNNQTNTSGQFSLKKEIP